MNLGLASLFSPILRELLVLAVNGSGAATLDSFCADRARVSGVLWRGACGLTLVHFWQTMNEQRRARG